jgi:hypothetical protein
MRTIGGPELDESPGAGAVGASEADAAAGVDESDGDAVGAAAAIADASGTPADDEQAAVGDSVRWLALCEREATRSGRLRLPDEVVSTGLPEPPSKQPHQLQGA